MCGHQFRAALKGDFVVLQVEVSNCPAYPFNFVVAQVIGEIGGVDTTNSETILEFQIYRPCTLNNIASLVGMSKLLLNYKSEEEN